MENEKLKKLLQALGQKDQLGAMGVNLGEQPSEDMIGEPEPRIPADIPKLGEPSRDPASIAEDRKQELLRELAARKMGVGQVEEEDELGLEQEEAAGIPDQEMKLKALQDVLMKMRK